MLLFIDDFSRKVFVYTIKSKVEVITKFAEFKALVENLTGKKIKVLRTDNGTEYVNTEFHRLCKDNGIIHQRTVPYTPEQNGVAERANRTIVERAKCLLFDAGLEKGFWAEATHMAGYIGNRVLNSKGFIPEEKFSNVKVDFSDWKIFGAPVMVHVPAPKRKKWDKKSVKKVFVGYDYNSKGYRVADVNTGAVMISRDVKFLREEVCNSSELTDVTSGNVPDEHENGIEEVTVVIYDIERPVNDDVVGEIPTKMPTPPRPIMTRSRTKAANPLNLVNFAMIAEPATYEEAIHHDDAVEWRSAMESEISSHDSNQTWTLVDLPKGSNVIKTKWVYKVKGEGDSIRYKARLVAKGCSQKYGIDYEETYSPVVRYNSIRFLLALAVQKDLEIFQMDAVTAYLQGDLEEDIYMEQPKGFKDNTGRVCRLNKAIYGLKQSGRVWNQKLDGKLRTFGLVPTKTDPCIYHNEENTLIVAIYVDDFLIFHKTTELLESLKTYLHEEFSMKDIGPVKNCIGMTITKGSDYMELDQSRYIQKILEKFGMLDCKPVKTPSVLGQKLTSDSVTDENSLVGKIPYQEAVGSLLYLTQSTRPDIVHAVNTVSRFNNKHSDEHWQAVKRIFRYLKGTINMKLRYSKAPDFKIHAYSDADWGGDLEKRRSCTGYMISLCDLAISWNSKLQTSIPI